MANWVSLLGEISIWIILVPLTFGVAFFRRLDYDSKLILLIVFVGSIPQVLRPILRHYEVVTIFYNLYTPIEFIVYWFLLRKKITLSSRRTFLNATAVIFFVFSAYLIWAFGIQTRFLNEWVIANNVFQVLWIGLCLLEYYHAEDAIIDLAQPFFWYLLGIICYAPCTVIFYSLWYFIRNHPDEQFHVLNAIHHIFNILLYIFFAIGMLKNRDSLKVQPLE